MCLEELKAKANGLPLSPGVYIMRDKSNTVIYVGKAKKLKNRVSQYFQDTASHSPKTQLMVSRVHDFDVIVATSEFEALVLECSLIKRYMPKYNILLKDDKGYPYIRLDPKEQYPRIELVSKRSDDGAVYYGPFGSRGVTQSLIDGIEQILKLPRCSRVFPRDIGKNRPCLNYHMNQCEGWCQEGRGIEQYRSRIKQAQGLLQGKYKHVTAELKAQMEEAAENLNFELAAGLRDRLKAVEALGQKQMVTTGTHVDTDVVGFYQNDTKACFAVLHFSDGNLVDKDYEILQSVEEPEHAVSTLISQFYLNRGFAPRQILLPFVLHDAELLEELFAQNFGKKSKVHVPQRGNNAQLVEMAMRNAKEEVERITSKEERYHGVLALLGKMLNLPTPKRIEAFDISNISGTDIVAGMVVFEGGKPKKSDYKRFSLRDMAGQDDYASMEQVITRRFTNYKNGDSGFEVLPDILLIDGGIAHAEIATRVLDRLGISIAVFGMVKDDRHRTRALVTPTGEEIAIDSQQSVFSFIGAIQEEVHRFAIGYHRQLRSKRLRYSELDTIAGVGPKRKQELLKAFKSIAAIKNASLDELMRILPADAANNVYNHFQKG